jgi:hypothetical protein
MNACPLPCHRALPRFHASGFAPDINGPGRVSPVIADTSEVKRVISLKVKPVTPTPEFLVVNRGGHVAVAPIHRVGDGLADRERLFCESVVTEPRSGFTSA